MSFKTPRLRGALRLGLSLIAAIWIATAQAQKVDLDALQQRLD
jgi:hypothetical protein